MLTYMMSLLNKKLLRMFYITSFAKKKYFYLTFTTLNSFTVHVLF